MGNDKRQDSHYQNKTGSTGEEYEQQIQKHRSLTTKPQNKSGNDWTKRTNHDNFRTDVPCFLSQFSERKIWWLVKWFVLLLKQYDIDEFTYLLSCSKLDAKINTSRIPVWCMKWWRDGETASDTENSCSVKSTTVHGGFHSLM